MLTRLRCYSFISAGGNRFLSCCKDNHIFVNFQTFGAKITYFAVYSAFISKTFSIFADALWPEGCIAVFAGLRLRIEDSDEVYIQIVAKTNRCITPRGIGIRLTGVPFPCISNAGLFGDGSDVIMQGVRVRFLSP